MCVGGGGQSIVGYDTSHPIVISRAGTAHGLRGLEPEFDEEANLRVRR